MLKLQIEIISFNKITKKALQIAINLILKCQVINFKHKKAIK